AGSRRRRMRARRSDSRSGGINDERLTMKRSSMVFLLLWISLAVSRPAAAAMNCSIQLSPFSFGNYDQGNAAPLDVTGQIGVRCVGSTGTFVAQIGAVGSASVRAEPIT